MAPSLDTIFSALADPSRRTILRMLLEDDMAVTDVSASFAMSLAAVSKHLSILTRAGLISQERRGRVVWCKIEPDSLRTASVWIQGFGLFEAVDLDRIEEIAGGAGLLSTPRRPEFKSEHEADDGNHDDDESDNVDDAVHGEILRSGG